MKKWFWLLFILLAAAGLVFAYVSKQDSVYVSLREEKIKITSPAKSILFVGDIMLGRYVETLSARVGDEMYPFKETSDYLKQYITIANLEGPIPENHKPTPINGFSFSFPSSSPRILKEAGITAVSLANNHMFDKGRSGYEETKRALGAEGVSHFGGYAPTETDYFETMLGTTTVIVYGITMIATGWDESQAIEVTRKLRNEHPNAYLIAYLHWGDEYSTQNRYQRAFAHSLIDDGVDAIIGSHPHVVQGVELYKNKPIFYSLGNFIFDQYWRSDVEDGLMVGLSTEGDAYIYELIPIDSNRSVPGIATGAGKDRILAKVSKLSDGPLKQNILQGSIVVPK